MNSKTHARTLATAAALAALAAFAPTAAADDRGFYIGGNYGPSSATIDRESIEDALINGGFTSVSIEDNEADMGFKAFGGYQFGRYFALELGYFDLGKFGFTATTVPDGSLFGAAEFKGINLDAVGILPLSERLSAVGRIGAIQTETSADFRGTGAVTVATMHTEASETNYKAGLGLQFALSPSWGIRLEGERYRVADSVGNDGDIDLYSVGLLYRFGKHAQAMASSSPAPAPMPVQAPVQVVVPVADPTQRYCSILDIQFTINNDEQQLQSAEKLGVLGTFMTKYPGTTAVIEGHTDDIGNDADNQALSQRRAQGAVDYLVGTERIARSRLSAVGYGESRPVADNGTQDGQRANRRINAVVACATDIADLAVAKARVTVAMLLEFDSKSAVVRPEHRDELRKVANYLIANPTMRAQVEGHTGNLEATPELAMQMSQQRAQAVVDYLVNNFGVPRSRLIAQGFGQTRRFAYSTSAEAGQENRRVNIVLDYPG